MKAPYLDPKVEAEFEIEEPAPPAKGTLLLFPDAVYRHVPPRRYEVIEVRVTYDPYPEAGPYKGKAQRAEVHAILRA